MDTTRRQFLAVAGLGAVALAAGFPDVDRRTGEQILWDLELGDQIWVTFGPGDERRLKVMTLVDDPMQHTRTIYFGQQVTQQQLLAAGIHVSAGTECDWATLTTFSITLRRGGGVSVGGRYV